MTLPSLNPFDGFLLSICHRYKNELNSLGSLGVGCSREQKWTIKRDGEGACAEEKVPTREDLRVGDGILREKHESA